MDYSQLTESVGEDGDVSSEAESVDVDVEFVGPTAQQAAAASYYPPRASRVGQGGAKKRQAGAKVGEKGEKRNIGVLFQPQSPLVMENMKVRGGGGREWGGGGGGEGVGWGEGGREWGRVAGREWREWGRVAGRWREGVGGEGESGGEMEGGSGGRGGDGGRE